MLTTREARQRLEQSNMGLSREGASVNWIVSFAEDDWRANTHYTTDDLLDAALQGAKMRRTRGPIK